MNARTRAIVRGTIILAALATAAGLLAAWKAQTHAPISCISLFERRHEHNGYPQINVLGPHANEEMFEGELFLYYPFYEKPQRSVRILRAANGTYAQSVTNAQLTEFSQGLATPGAIEFDLPTSSTSQRRFPFDSARFDLRLSLQPAIRPGGVIIRNMSSEFMLQCSSMEAQ